MLGFMSESQAKPYPLRMPPTLREHIDARAKAHNRSLNTEIVLLLQQALEGSVAAGPGIDVDVLAEALAAKLAIKLKQPQG
jgi:hypothetical protein